MQTTLLSRIQSALPTHTNSLLPIISTRAATDLRSRPSSSSFFSSNHELSIPLRPPSFSPESIIDLTRHSRDHSPADILSCLYQIRLTGHKAPGRLASERECPALSSPSSPASGPPIARYQSSPSSNVLLATSSSSPCSDPTPPPPSSDPLPLSDSAWLSHFYLTIAHLHHTLPSFFSHAPSFPPSIYDPSLTLCLPPPLFPGGGMKLPSLRAYGLFFGAARQGLGMLLGEPWVRVERVVVLPPREGGLDGEGNKVRLPPALEGEARKQSETGEDSQGRAEGKEAGKRTGAIARGRLDRKVRVMVKVGGRLRVSAAGPLLGGGEGVDKEWSISNLYTFSPTDARIITHHVESVHPNPSEVARWLGGWSMLGIAGASSMGGGGGDSSNSGGGQGVHGEGEDHHPGWASFRGMGLELEGIGEREREGLRRLAEGGRA